MKAKKFDLIVIGGGSGLRVAHYAQKHMKKIAIIEKGPMGGTCLNRGCIPSKIVIHRAEIMETISRAKEFGITVAKGKANFAKIMTETNATTDGSAQAILRGLKANKKVTVYRNTAKFVGPKLVKVGKDVITADKIVIAAGTRPSLPPVEGLNKVPYLTSKEVLRLRKLPKSIIFVGGGYISVELANFFNAMGCKVTIVQRNTVLIPREDPEVSEVFTEQYAKRMKVYLGHSTNAARKVGKQVEVSIKRKDGKGATKKLKADCLVVATGRKPNSDILDVEKGGVKINKHGYIESNDYLETNVKGVYVLGDIAGKYLFKHSANHEADYVLKNMFGKKRQKVDYTAMPHAIFGSPEVAGVGLNERQLEKNGTKYVVCRKDYMHTGKGMAIKDHDGFCKFLVDPKSRKILGCHILGANASILIHEVLMSMKMGSGKIDDIINTIHIHPALNEVVQRAAMEIDNQ